MTDTANTVSKSGDELHKQPGDIRVRQLFLTSQMPRLLNKLKPKKSGSLHEHH